MSKKILARLLDTYGGLFPIDTARRIRYNTNSESVKFVFAVSHTEKAKKNTPVLPSMDSTGVVFFKALL